MKQVQAFPMIPENDNEVRKIFGDIREFISDDGTLSPEWEMRHIARIRLPEPVPYAYSTASIERITVHVALVDLAVALYTSIWEKDLVEALGPYGGGFEFRKNANDKQDISLHAYGIAWDWNPKAFPNRSSKKRDPKLVAEFRRFGLLCGQDFAGTKDPMHFQFARNT